MRRPWPRPRQARTPYNAQGIPTAELEAFGGYAMKLQGEGAVNFRPEGGIQLSLFGGQEQAATLAAMAAESKVVCCLPKFLIDYGLKWEEESPAS